MKKYLKFLGLLTAAISCVTLLELPAVAEEIAATSSEPVSSESSVTEGSLSDAPDQFSSEQTTPSPTKNQLTPTVNDDDSNSQFMTRFGIDVRDLTAKDLLSSDKNIQDLLWAGNIDSNSLVFINSESNVKAADKLDRTLPNSQWYPQASTLFLPKAYEKGYNDKLYELQWVALVVPVDDAQRNLGDFLNVQQPGQKASKAQLEKYFQDLMTKWTSYETSHTEKISGDSYVIPSSSLIRLDAWQKDTEEEQRQESQQEDGYSTFHVILDANEGIFHNLDKQMKKNWDQGKSGHVVSYTHGLYNDKGKYDEAKLDFATITLAINRKFGLEKSASILAVPVRKGYLFRGWSDEKLSPYAKGKVDSAKLLSYPYKAKDSSKSVTFYAVWERSESSSIPKTGDPFPILILGLLCFSGLCLLILKIKAK